jgi:hypothetical protein
MYQQTVPMAKEKKQKPFNLLYKFDAQKTGIDKLYDFVTVEGRYIVVSVMFVIILAFIYRFPLDKKLNDEINRSAENIAQLEYFSKSGMERQFRDIEERTESAKKYMAIYPEELTSATENESQIKIADLIKRIREIHENTFKNDLIIVDYSYSSAPDQVGTLKITGSSTTFSKAEEFRQQIRLEKTLVNDVLINNLGSTKDGVPKFGLDIKVK